MLFACFTPSSSCAVLWQVVAFILGRGQLLLCDAYMQPVHCLQQVCTDKVWAGGCGGLDV